MPRGIGPASRKVAPPAANPVSEVRALLTRDSERVADEGAQPFGPNVIPQLFDDGDDGDSNDSLDPNLLFGPRQSGATVLLDLNVLGPVIDGLKQAPPTALPGAFGHGAVDSQRISLASIELGPPAPGVAPRQHPAWTASELVVMAISFLVVAVPALYFVFAKLI